MDLKLYRAIESNIMAVPKAVRSAYPKDELVNSVFLILKARRVRKPSKLVIRSAAIDHHRRITHFNPGAKKKPRNPRKRSVSYGNQHLPDDKQVADKSIPRQQIFEALRDIRRRFGNDGLTVFLLTRIMELDARTVARIMDYEPTSALARSIGDIGADYTS